MSDDDNVKSLPVRFKPRGPEDRTLIFPHEAAKHGCSHAQWDGARFIVDESLAEVTCSLCNEKLNPMWVLRQLCAQDNKFHEAHRRYNDEQKRLSDRTRTKCDSCGKLTRISRR